MSRLQSASTVYVNAYLTDLGRKYFTGFESDGSSARFDGDEDLFKPERFSLYDSDVNYKTSARLESGDVPSITGSDGCLKTSANQLRENVLQSNPDDIPFDFAVVRYIWTPIQTPSGIVDDLDTATAIYGTDSAVDGDYVGYGLKTIIGEVYGSPYLRWGLDNVDGGVESVLIDFKKLSEDFETKKEFEVKLNALWYTTSNVSGNIFIELDTYTGGEMVYDSATLNFLNEGGATTSNRIFENFLDVNRNVALGKQVGLIRFDSTTKKGKLIRI